MKFNTQRQGELFILGETLLWSVFPIITIQSYSALSPLESLAWSTLLGAFFFAILLSIKGKWREIYNASALVDILLGSLFIGVIFYIFFFFGLKYTSPGNAAVLALLETFYSYLFFNIWKKEYISSRYLIGVFFMILGAFIILARNFISSLNWGDLLIVVGVVAAPFGNYFQRRAREKVSSETILFVRSIITAPVIFFLAYLISGQFTPLNSWSILLLLFINGFFLFGLSKLFWIEGIHRIAIVKANALHNIGPLFTILLAWLFLAQPPTIFQFLAFIPLFVGVKLLSV